MQGMLNMMEVDTCYFAVWTPAQLHVERVARDTELWSGVMVPALLQFYRYTVSLYPQFFFTLRIGHALILRTYFLENKWNVPDMEEEDLELGKIDVLEGLR